MTIKRTLATLAVASMLAAAGLIGYNGHAGLGANVAVKDGTSNTLFVGTVLMADMGGQ